MRNWNQLVIVIVTFATVLFGAAAICQASTKVPVGDVNGDGVVNIVDALFIAQYTVGLRELPAGKCKLRDRDGDSDSGN